MGREEKGKGGDRGDLVEKKKSQKGETAIRPVISLPSKNKKNPKFCYGTNLEPRIKFVLCNILRKKKIKDDLLD